MPKCLNSFLLILRKGLPDPPAFFDLRKGLPDPPGFFDRSIPIKIKLKGEGEGKNVVRDGI